MCQLRQEDLPFGTQLSGQRLRGRLGSRPGPGPCTLWQGLSHWDIHAATRGSCKSADSNSRGLGEGTGFRISDKLMDVLDVLVHVHFG